MSICKTPINELARILISKSGDRTVTKLPEAEVDEDRQFVAGWASVVSVGGKPLIDAQGDTMTEEDLVASAEEFMRSYRRGKKSHQGDADKVEFVQSVVFTKEVQDVLGIDLGFVGWWLGGYVRDDELWEDVRAGTFRGFSVGGSAVRLVVEDEASVSKSKKGGPLSLAQALARTPRPSPAAIARLGATSARKQAAPAPKVTPPKVTTPSSPKPSTAGIEAARRALAQASPQQREGVKVMERIAAPRNAPDHARNALAAMLATEAAEREGKAAPSANRALDAGRAAIKRLTQGQ